MLPTVEPKNERRLLPLMLGFGGLLLVAGLGAAVRFWIADRAETVVAGRAVPRGFCGDLKQVAAAGPTKFVSILGPLRNAVWTARIQLPGWDNCSVQDWTYEGKTTRYFGCELPTFANIIELDATLDAVDAYVKPCLGHDWVRRRIQFSDKTSDVTHERGQDDPIVRLRESHYANSDVWILKIAVEVPGPS